MNNIKTKPANIEFLSVDSDSFYFFLAIVVGFPIV